MVNDNKIDELRTHLTEYVHSITELSGGTNMYVCPLCGSGKGKNHTGAFSIYDNGRKWKCFKCDSGGDLFELIGQYEHISDFKSQMDRAAEIFHIMLDSNDEYKRGDMIMERTETKSVKNETTAKEESEMDYTEKFNIANRQLFDERYKEGLEYLHKRGISNETAKKFGLGYDPAWRHPKAPKVVPTSPRIIIPTSKSTYFVRDIRSNLSENDDKYKKQNVGGVNMLNTEALYNSSTPVFIVEGQIDMLSIIEVGGNAIALGSTSQVNEFLSLVGKKPPVQPLIIALDNDSAGESAASKLINGLDKLGIPYIKYNPAGHYKDVNDALVADREAFTKAVQLGNDFEKLKAERIKANNEKHMQLSNGRHIQGFINNIANSINDVCIPTGFKYLDDCIGGGLHPELFLVGAVPSLGKTTFVLQIADNAAYCGNDVLFFSLEMSRFELMAKSVSRHTATYLIENGKTGAKAKSTREILSGKCHQFFNEAEKIMFEESTRRYAEYADRLFVQEGVGNISADNVRKTVEEHIAATGKTPLVIIDYLQILAPCDGYDKSAERIIADKTTMELKRISRDFKTPVIVISSFNRQNYNSEVSFASFKESGGLEYSADTLLGLQFNTVGTAGYSDTKAKSSDKYNIELVILKQRNGKVGNKIKFDFFPDYNYFVEVKDQGKR